jgi:hypothetical protein
MFFHHRGSNLIFPAIQESVSDAATAHGATIRILLEHELDCDIAIGFFGRGNVASAALKGLDGRTLCSCRSTSTRLCGDKFEHDWRTGFQRLLREYFANVGTPLQMQQRRNALFQELVLLDIY